MGRNVGSKPNPGGPLTKEQRSQVEAMGNDLFGPGIPIQLEKFPPWVAPSGISVEILSKILMDVAGGMSVRKAAINNGTTLITVLRHRLADPNGFGKAMDEAITYRLAILEDKAFELAVEGQEETMTKGSGPNKITMTRTSYPTAALLQFLLKAADPEKYGIDRKEVRAGPLDTPPEIIRSESDRKKLLGKLKGLIEQRQAVAIATASEFADLL